jgi:general secretion pathway protein J
MRVERGFTLVELLVAMTVLGLISLALFGSLHFGATAWQRSDGQGSSVEQIELAETVLRRALTSAYPYLSASDPTDPHILFHGTDSQISFLAPAPEALGGAGFARFTIAAVPGENGVRLTIEAALELAAAGTAAQPPSVLIKGLDRVNFAYYGTDEPGVPPAWHDGWNDRFSLPGLVRISAAFPAGDVRHWSDLVIAPRIGADQGCVLDPLGHRCQGR